MARLNEHQVRHVVSTFAHVDGLLSDIERLARDDLSPFAKERPDLAPEEARLLQSFISLARTRMLTALDRLGIPRPQPNISARWSAGTALTFADIALSEITESSLRGYGAIDPAAAAELVALATDLRGFIARGKALLHESDVGGLRERLAMLPGNVGEVLRSIERVSTDHGLAEVRPLIAAAAERAAAMTFDVGIFGRVSAGKSSLINALIGAAVLPVGATPVTAVPIRIASGDARATVTLLDGKAVTIDMAEIPAYATEAQNPQNTKGVRAIEVQVPSVPLGLRLLDTPGVGSLGSSGPAQTYAWLPRCDLGLVLIAAGTAVGRDDLALVAGLGNAGIACRVLLSKADTLSEEELERAVAYVHSELTTVLGPDRDIEIRPVSVAPGQQARLEALRRDVLAPLAADHARAAHVALKVRLHRLVGATSAALQGRGGGAPIAVDTYKARAAAADIVRRETDRLSAASADVLREAADAIAGAWASNTDPQPAARSSIVNAGARALAIVRSAIDQASQSAGGDPASNGAGVDRSRRLPPLFDPDFLDALPPLTPPPLGRQLLGHRIALSRLEPIAIPLRDALSRYAARLYAWGIGQLEELNEPSNEPSVDGSTPAVPEHTELSNLDALIDAA
jgi:GTP-binding protein EngB required for normal cell division